MRLLLATATLGAAFLGCLSIVRAARRGPLGLALPLALSLLVCLEALLLRALSPMRAVAAGPVAIGNLLLAGVGALVAARVPRARRFRLRWRGLLRPVPLAVLGLLALILVSALAYRPNNWDSLTYHLARVAHWIQNRSVAPFPTGDPRQVVLPPGAEYLLLALQVVSGSDRADALVQVGAWVAVVAAAVPLARAFGARRKVARAAALLVAAAPMAVLQASSTQNDLVAAALAMALAAAGMPLLHSARRVRGPDLALAIVALAASALVKPTALIAAGPLLAWAAGTCAAARLGMGRRALPAAALAAALALALVAPTASSRGVPEAEEYLYGRTPQLVDRAANVLRGSLRQLWAPDMLGAALAPPQTRGCDRPRSLCLEYARWNHEDFTGSPLLAGLILVGLASAAMGWRRASARARLGAAAWTVGWLLLHAVFRDNTWIPRLELPSMMLAPLALGALRVPWLEVGSGRAVMVTLLALALGLGARTVVRNERRPLFLDRLRSGGLEDAYYPPDAPAGIAARHREVLDALQRSGCRRLSLRLGVNAFDYPLTWRAMQRGIEVRARVDADGWACALFTDQGPPAGAGALWLESAVEGFYVAAPRSPQQSQ